MRNSMYQCDVVAAVIAVSVVVEECVDSMCRLVVSKRHLYATGGAAACF